MAVRLITYPYGAVRARALATGLLPPKAILRFAAGEGGGDLPEVLTGRAARDGEATAERIERAYIDFGRTLIEALPAFLAPLFIAYLGRNELENLLAACRHLRGENRPSWTGRPLPTLGPAPQPPFAECRNLAELAHRLPEGCERRILEECAGEASGDESGACEDRLLAAYWGRVSRAVARLPLLDREIARDLLGLRADIDTARGILRGLARQRPARALLAERFALTRHFAPGRLERLLRSARDPDALARKMLPGDRDDAREVETALWRELRREARRALRLAPLGVGVPLAALLLKEQESLDLLGGLGGRRYGLSGEEIAPLLRSGGW